MSRPRTIPDRELIEAAYDLIMEHGPKGLTFERLGKKVNLVPGALVRRFTNKEGLLMEVDRYALERSNAQIKVVMAQHASPIDAILAGFIAEMAFASTIERFIHGQEYLLFDLGHADLYKSYHKSFEDRHRTVAELLAKAQARGELSKAIDPKEFAQFLQMILHGSGHVWAMAQEGSIETYIRRYVRLALRPYQQNK